jgi:hypothetical protein
MVCDTDWAIVPVVYASVKRGGLSAVGNEVSETATGSIRLPTPRSQAASRNAYSKWYNRHESSTQRQAQAWVDGELTGYAS